MSIVSNVAIYGVDQSVKASKYPMAVKTADCDAKVTERQVALAQSPIGSGHDQYLTGIVVQFDLTFSKQAWAEAERYHFLDFVSSQSTMHRITKLDPEEQCNEYVDSRAIELLRELVQAYNEEPTPESYLRVIYNTPSGFRLTARMTTNYRQLKTIYAQRRHHRLPEWRTFCAWLETLPCSWMITGGSAQ